MKREFTRDEIRSFWSAYKARLAVKYEIYKDDPVFLTGLKTAYYEFTLEIMNLLDGPMEDEE